MFTSNGDAASGDQLMSAVYDANYDADGFLYLTFKDRTCVVWINGSTYMHFPLEYDKMIASVPYLILIYILLFWFREVQNITYIYS